MHEQWQTKTHCIPLPINTGENVGSHRKVEGDFSRPRWQIYMSIREIGKAMYSGTTSCGMNL